MLIKLLYSLETMHHLYLLININIFTSKHLKINTQALQVQTPVLHTHTHTEWMISRAFEFLTGTQL